jgi:hypothetical protein
MVIGLFIKGPIRNQTKKVNMIIGIILLIAGIISALLAGYHLKKKNRLSSLPVVSVENIAAADTDVIVSGVAAGTTVGSPWTQREGLLFDATETTEYQERDRDGQRRTRTETRHLGTRCQQLLLASADNKPLAVVDTNNKLDLLHFKKMVVPTTVGSFNVGGVNVGLGGAPRGKIEEISIVAGAPLWVVGKVVRHNDQFVIQGDSKLVLSGQDPESMLKHLTKKVFIFGSVAAALIVAAMVSVVLF